MNRRSWLAVALIAMLALAGCVGGLSDDDTSDSELVEYVSADAKLVVGAEMSVVQDEESNTAFDAFSGPILGTSDAELDEAVAEFENETGLDPAAVDGVLAYAIEDDPAVIMQTDWTEEDIVAAVEDEEMTEYESEEYAGHTVYTSTEDDPAGEGEIGVLDDGVYVFGTEDLVRTTIDVAAGDADALDGQLRSAYEDTSGAVVAAFDVENEDIPEAGPGQEVDPTPLRDVDVLGVGYTSGEGTVSVDATLYTASESAAEDVTMAIDGLLGWAIESSPEEAIVDELEAIEVSQDGDQVQISYDGDPEDLDEIEAV